MKLWSQARSVLRGWRLLRALVQGQQLQLQQMQQQTLALQSIAASVRLMAAQEAGQAASFITGPADGKDDSGLIRQSETETFELLEWERVLTARLGRPPLDQEVVAAWQEWKESR